MKKKAFIGLDIGTTGARSCIFDETGKLLAMEKKNYQLIQPRPGWVEQDPDEIVEAVLVCLKESLNKMNSDFEIAAIGLSSVFHSIMLVDKNFDKLTNLIIWGDSRSSKFLEVYKDSFKDLYSRTGCPFHTIYPLLKLIWLKHEAPDLLNKSTRIISIKEYVLKHLSQKCVVDYSVASGSGLFNIHTKQWENNVFNELNIDIEKMSETVSPTTVVGNISKEVFEKTGLKEGTPIVIGAGDGVLSSLGSNSIKKGKMTAMLGTSGAVRMAVNRPVTSDEGKTWCYILDENTWIVGCAINNAGLVVTWYLDNFFPEMKKAKNPYKELEFWAKDIKPGAEGLVFLPFLTGERSPYWNSNAKGILFGLGLHHDRRHIMRAIVEGVCFRMRSIYEAVSDTVNRPKEIIFTGGLARSKLWGEVLASILQSPLLITNIEEASALGAAVMAMKGTGYIKDYTEITEKNVNAIYTQYPNKDNSNIYNKLYKIYLDLYWKTKDTCDEVSNFDITNAKNCY